MPEESILEMSPDFLSHQVQKERSRKRYEAKNKKRSQQWGEDREDGGWPDYEY